MKTTMLHRLRHTSCGLALLLLSLASIPAFAAATPVCTLSASPSSVALGALSTLTAVCSSSSGGITSYQWTGAGCTQEKTASCKVTPTIDTTYTVTATDADGQTSSVASAQVTILSTATTAPFCTLEANPPAITPSTFKSVVLTAKCTPEVTKGYVWTGGSCSTVTSESCPDSPRAKTTYSVTGTNSIGKGNTATVTVDVSSTSITPTPAFKCALTASPYSVSSGESSALTASCSPAAASYTWSVAGCSGASCRVTPSATTTYTVTGKLGTEASSASASVTVTPKATTTPVCTLEANPPTITPSTFQSVVLTAKCTPEATKGYVWTGGNCSTVTSGSCSDSPTVKTTYSVTGTNSFGKSNTATVTVDVSPPPTTPTFKCSLSASPASISPGESSTLTASCSPVGASYTWSVASCSGATCTVTPAATTAYTVTGKFGAATSSANASVTVVPKATTAPVCTLVSNPPAITPSTFQTVVLTAKCTPEATKGYVWTGGGCSSSTLALCSDAPSAKTTYSVIGTNSVGKSNPATATVEVLSSTSHACTLSATPSTVTLGQLVTLTVACPGFNMLNYTWSAITGCPATGPTCAFTPPKAGTFSYNVTVNLELGLTDTPSTTVTVNAAATPAKPVCELMASPLSVTVGSPVMLTANCVPSAGIFYLWSSNTSCAGSATCTLTPTADTTYTVKGSNAGVESDLQSVSVKVIPAASYQGLWWNPNESGWGISLTQHDASSAKPKRIFAAIYTYDTAGQPTWYALSDCPILAAKAGSCTGDIYKVTGGSTPLVPWVAAVKPESEGTGTLTFTDASHGQFDYTFKDSVKRSKAIEKLAFASGTTQFPVDYTDLWWSEGESGWGVALTQDQGMFFASWYAYDDQGNPVWYTASSCPLIGTASAGSCTGDLYRVTGGLSLTQSWDNAHQVSLTDVGRVTFEFTDKDKGEMTYNIDGKSGFRAIARFRF